MSVMPPVYCQKCGIDVWSNPEAFLDRIWVDRVIGLRILTFECDCHAQTEVQVTDVFIDNLTPSGLKQYMALMYQKSRIPMKP